MRAESERKGTILAIKNDYLTVKTKGFVYYFMAVVLPTSPYFTEGQVVEFSPQINHYSDIFDGQFVLLKKHKIAKDTLGEII